MPYMQREKASSESSEKIRKALRFNVRTYADEEFVIGDTVYY